MFSRGEEIVRLIEEAMSESCSDEYSHEAIYEQGLKEFALYLLLFIQLPYDKVCRQQSYQPAQRIPAHGETAYMESLNAWVPVYIQHLVLCFY